MSFSFLGSLAGLLPGYLQGQRLARQDNWDDLMKYNQVQQGQLSNAFTEATWQPRLDMFYDQGWNSAFNTQGHFLDLMAKQAGAPGDIMMRQAYSMYSPMLAPMSMQAQLMALANAFRTQGSLGSNMQQTPSVVRQ